MIAVALLAFGGTPLTPSIDVGAIVVGTVFLILAFRSRPIRKIHGLGNKLKAFTSDYGEGPDVWGRVFFGGVGAIVIGTICLVFLR
jgi:hypothetical protein